MFLVCLNGRDLTYCRPLFGFYALFVNNFALIHVYSVHELIKLKLSSGCINLGIPISRAEARENLSNLRNSLSQVSLIHTVSLSSVIQSVSAVCQSLQIYIHDTTHSGCRSVNSVSSLFNIHVSQRSLINLQRDEQRYHSDFDR